MRLRSTPHRMKAFSSARDEDGLLHFADCEVAWGEFQELEGWLREHGIPFQRQSSGKYEYDPCFVEFRPDLPGKPDRYTLTTQEGAPVICHEEIEKAMQGMAKLVDDKKTAGCETLAGVGEDLPRTDPRYSPKAAAFAAFRDCGWLILLPERMVP